MLKICEICENKYETNSSTRIYCYKCSGESTRSDNKTRKHQKTILRRSMKVQAIKLLGGKCTICGYIYDDSKEEVKFEDLPDDWKCPICGVGKDMFEKVTN